MIKHSNSSPLTPLQNGEGNQRQPQTVFTQLPKTLLENARELRKNLTSAEKLLWQLLRSRQMLGLKFRRQHPLPGNYVLDFYCAEKRLAVELDGNIHLEKEQKEYDAVRTEVLKEYGIKVLRFWNSNVLNNTEDVLMKIAVACTFPSPLMEKGRDEE